MNDPMDHATGIEKRELEQFKSGNKDPWLLDTVLKRGPGTKEQPNMIPSAFDGRIVGCSCKLFKPCIDFFLENRLHGIISKQVKAIVLSTGCG